MAFGTRSIFLLSFRMWQLLFIVCIYISLAWGYACRVGWQIRDQISCKLRISVFTNDNEKWLPLQQLQNWHSSCSHTTLRHAWKRSSRGRQGKLLKEQGFPLPWDRVEQMHSWSWIPVAATRAHRRLSTVAGDLLLATNVIFTDKSMTTSTRSTCRIRLIHIQTRYRLDVLGGNLLGSPFWLVCMSKSPIPVHNAPSNTLAHSV